MNSLLSKCQLDCNLNKTIRTQSLCLESVFAELKVTQATNLETCSITGHKGNKESRNVSYWHRILSNDQKTQVLQITKW